MRSTASFKGHPIHPALVAFPIGLLITGWLFDVIGTIVVSTGLWGTATYVILAGLIFGLLAAIPGVIDYFTTVPPESSAKVRATKHALANSSALLLFFVGWIMRGGIMQVEPGWVVLGLETVGVILLGIGGWMGGTLVYRNVIGVDMRYAGAGRWKEIRRGVAPVGEGIDVGHEKELDVDHMKLVHVGKRRIVVARDEKGYVAFDDHCTHRGGSLAGGMMICGTVQCPWHGSQFDVRDGSVKAGPATETIRTYRTEIRNRRVLLFLDRGE